jgi:predicted transcriptional regulator
MVFFGKTTFNHTPIMYTVNNIYKCIHAVLADFVNQKHVPEKDAKGTKHISRAESYGMLV